MKFPKTWVRDEVLENEKRRKEVADSYTRGYQDAMKVAVEIVNRKVSYSVCTGKVEEDFCFKKSVIEALEAAMKEKK